MTLRNNIDSPGFIIIGVINLNFRHVTGDTTITATDGEVQVTANAPSARVTFPLSLPQRNKVTVLLAAGSTGFLEIYDEVSAMVVDTLIYPEQAVDVMKTGIGLKLT